MHSEYNQKPRKSFKEIFLKFWCTEKGKMSLIRDVVIALILVLILLTALWSYTGQWWGAPMVAIESGSMMHDDETFGRFGTIDAGDMVLLVKIDSKSDIIPRGSSIHGALASKDSDNYFYGDYGDVIVYHPYGREDTDQIIHRAMCWIEYNDDGTYTVIDYGKVNQPSINIPELGLKNYQPSHSGFITKGDNNAIADQSSPQLCTEPIKVEWISGKARQELPWIGTVNLFFNDITSGGSTVGNVPGDSIACLIVVIVILISIPVSLDFYDYYKNKKKEPAENNSAKVIYSKEINSDSSEEIEKNIDEKL